MGKIIVVVFRGDTMDKNNLKNIIVLKNLPSNIVDEAIVILKPNKKIEIVGNKNKYIENKTNTNIHVINEAEMLVSNYISKLENKNTKSNNGKLKNKYQRLKKYSMLISFILVLSIILHFI